MSEELFRPLVEVITTFQDRMDDEIATIAKLSTKLQDACSDVQASWSGSFAGWHGWMYFRNFSRPGIYERFSGEWGDINGIPDGWEQKSTEQVSARIDRLVGDGFSVVAYEERVKNARTALEDFKADLEVELALLPPDTVAKAQTLVDALRAFSFGKTKTSYIQSHLPGSIMTRDMEALRQGTCIPSWLYYDGVAYEGEQISESFTQYRKQLDRFIRQATALTRQSKEGVIARPGFFGIHPEIQAKCASLYETGAYPEAVEKSFKVVRDRLRSLTGYETGSDAFGKGDLYVGGASAANVDEDFNEAVKFLTMAIDRFRNEKSHTSDANLVDPARAYQYLTMSSLALSLLEKAEVKLK